MERQRNSNLDMARGLAVILVIFIHIRFPNKLGTIAADLGCLCNALFFLLSGYFSLHNTKRKLLNKAVRSFLLVLGSYLFYAVIYRDSVAVIISGVPDIFIANVNRCGNLWFAVALVYCYIIYYFVGEIDIKFVLVLGLIISILFSTYCPTMYSPVFQTFFYGVPLFFLGNFIASKKMGLVPGDRKVMRIVGGG